MAKKSYDELVAAIKSERLRLKKKPNSYGTQFYKLVSPEFVKEYSEDALIRWMHEHEESPQGDARAAAHVMRAELALRTNANSKLAASWARIAGYAALFTAFLTLATCLPQIWDQAKDIFEQNLQSEPAALAKQPPQAPAE